MSDGPMLNAYPDSCGGRLADIVEILKKDEFKDCFSSFYILPSIFNTDLDRGFSVINYDINEVLGSREDLEELKKLGLDLKLDFILNHASVLSPQFQDIIKKGDDSEYRDFFIDWNRFWEGCGSMTPEGYIRPDDSYIRDMFFRKPGLPILMVRFPDGRDVPYWNTFYQEVRYTPVSGVELVRELGLQYTTACRIADTVNEALAGGKSPKDIIYGEYGKYADRVNAYLEQHRTYLGQMDLNIKSPRVWEFYEDTLKKLAGYGARIVRLDAFAYAPKEPGLKNFMNDPGTWELLEKIRAIADRYGITLLPEIHAGYGEKVYELVAGKGYMTYDFFLPGLILHDIEKHDGSCLVRWAEELVQGRIRTVNMLGCHDGIPLLDLKGFLPDNEIEELISILVARGGYVKNLHGSKNMYYQVNATYFSALGEDTRRMLFARALQIFMPGKPQIWYLDIFDGVNDCAAVKRAGAGGHKEINRTNLSAADIEDKLKDQTVREQLRLLRLRNTHPAFGFDSRLDIEREGSCVIFTWTKGEARISLKADFADYSYVISE